MENLYTMTTFNLLCNPILTFRSPAVLHVKWSAVPCFIWHHNIHLVSWCELPCDKISIRPQSHSHIRNAWLFLVITLFTDRTTAQSVWIGAPSSNSSLLASLDSNSSDSTPVLSAESCWRKPFIRFLSRCGLSVPMFIKITAWSTKQNMLKHMKKTHTDWLCYLLKWLCYLCRVKCKFTRACVHKAMVALSRVA